MRVEKLLEEVAELAYELDLLDYERGMIEAETNALLKAEAEAKHQIDILDMKRSHVRGQMEKLQSCGI